MRIGFVRFAAFSWPQVISSHVYRQAGIYPLSYFQNTYGVNHHQLVKGLQIQLFF